MMHNWYNGKEHDTKTIALDILKKHEGLRLKPYRCTAGKLTIGYGRNLEDKGISEREALSMLMEDIGDTYNFLNSRYGWFHELNRSRQAVCIDMAYNLGMAGFHSFKKTRLHLANHDFDLAAREMLDSKWAKQVGQRAKDLAKIMKEGV